MTHLWSVPNSQAQGISTTVCGVQIDRLADGDSIRERGLVECAACRSPETPNIDRQARTTFLESYRPTLIAYLKAKLEAEDWHGVQDAASDLRDLDCELDGLRYPG